ncbi:uncharacterized protein LOC117175081 isoform X2 [Belonocnema kinseyi]|uniref:uncharacterized protein LOC117175081 isoform X2 n=1 Tax=Belonocnema kinseyi TaxID=2817044 RepID=UPI00143CCDD4|nr:uncharacterized protein LOC117175081 isoform X2 [Belonocnema kinseyi]
MKIDTGPLILAIAIFLPNWVESASDDNEKLPQGGRIIPYRFSSGSSSSNTGHQNELTPGSYRFPQVSSSNSRHSIGFPQGTRIINYTFPPERVPIKVVKDWEGLDYGIHVGGRPGYYGMVYPYGTYNVISGSPPEYSITIVQPQNGQQIFRAGKHAATVQGTTMYEVHPNGAFVEKDGQKVRFWPESKDILSNDGVHRYAAYENGFRLYNEGQRTLIRQRQGQLRLE